MALERGRVHLLVHSGSRGLGEAVLRAHAELPGRILLAGMQPAVKRLLELTRTAAFFRVAPDRASALSALAQPSA